MKKIFKIYALLTVLFGISPLLCIESFAQTAGEINEGGNIWYDPETDTRWELINGDWYLIHEPGGGEDPNGGGNNEPPQGGGNDYDDWDYDDWYDYWDEQWDYWDWDEYWNTVIFGGGSGPNNNNNPLLFTCPTLKSATNKEPNRERTILGIGEVFSVEVENFCIGSNVAWEVINSDGAEGLITFPDPNDPPVNSRFAYFEAGYKPGKITIRASFQWVGKCADEGCVEILEKEFTVIEPSGIKFQLSGDWCTNYHEHKRPSGGFSARMYLTPNTVNFHKLEIKEDTAPGDCDGPYWQVTTLNCDDHDPADWAEVTDEVTQFGTLVSKADAIRFLWRCNLESTNPAVQKEDSNNEGFKQWLINCRYRKQIIGTNSDQGTVFTSVLQRGHNAGGANSVFTTSKENVVVTNNVNDPDNCALVPPALKCNN